MSVTKQFVTLGDHNLVPLSPFILNMVYGDDDYVRSVFGTTDITRQDIEQYYQKAKLQWRAIKIDRAELHRLAIGAWLRQNKISGLDFYFPINHNCVWFKQDADAFAFTLKFGIIDK